MRKWSHDLMHAMQIYIYESNSRDRWLIYLLSSTCLLIILIFLPKLVNIYWYLRYGGIIIIFFYFVIFPSFVNITGHYMVEGLLIWFLFGYGSCVFLSLFILKIWNCCNNR